MREWPSGSIGNNIERFLDFARNDRRGIRDIRTTIDEKLRSSPQDELAVASLRKFLCVVFRPAVAGLLECARVLASLLGEKAVDRKAMRRRLALPKHFVQDAVPDFYWRSRSVFKRSDGTSPPFTPTNHSHRLAWRH